jgi:hypothetical protein
MTCIEEIGHAVWHVEGNASSDGSRRVLGMEVVIAFPGVDMKSTPIDVETIVGQAAGRCRRPASGSSAPYFATAVSDTFATSALASAFCTKRCTSMSDADAVLP